MIFKFLDDGRDLVPVGEIESLVISDDQMAVTTFRNFLTSALTSGKIKPRNTYGFQVDLVPHFQLNESALDDLSGDLVREINRPRSITDFARDVDPSKVKRMARTRMEREAQKALKGAVLAGFLAKDDIRAFLESQGIGSEWVSSQSAPTMEASDLQEGSTKSAPRIVISDTKKRRFALDDPIDAAIQEHGHKIQSIWSQLIEWAMSRNQTFTELIGFTEQGIQYKGKQFQADGVPDILTRKQLAARIRRRQAAHCKPL